MHEGLVATESVHAPRFTPRIKTSTVPMKFVRNISVIIPHFCRQPRGVYNADMSGHNKWSQIKHQKGAADAAKSGIWGKLSRRITVESKAAHGDVTLRRSAKLHRESAQSQYAEG